MQTQVLGLSVDSAACLKAWAETLGGIAYPLLSDFYPHGKVAEMYGMLRSEGYTERAILVIDKQGIIRHLKVYVISEQPDIEELFRVLAEVDPAAASAQVSQSADEPRPFTEPIADVVMYCTPWCPDCGQARRFLEQNNIAYTEIDISRERTAAQLVRSWANGKEITPTFNIKGRIIVNFERAKLEEILGLKR